MKYLVAITLPHEFSEKILTVQKNYKSSAWNILIEPHLTLLPPALALCSISEIETILTEVAASFQPFSLQVSGLSRFYNKSNTVFLSIAESEPLGSLHKSLLQICPTFMALQVDRRRSQEFLPHITLSNKLNDVLADQILLQLQDLDFNYRFDCQGFSLFKKNESDQHWQQVREFLF